MKSDDVYTWPGKTIVWKSYEKLYVQWNNKIPKGGYILTGKCQYEGESVVDETLHWAYSLHGLEGESIEETGVPMVVHLHGGHTRDIYDGNPEFFYSPHYEVVGPQFKERVHEYDNDQPAASLWFHDHVSEKFSISFI